MSSEAISGLSSLALNTLAATQGTSVNDLVARGTNARLSSGLNISKLITEKRQAISNATVDQLLTPEKRQKLKELQEKVAANASKIASGKQFISLDQEIEALARQNLNAGKAGAFGGSRFLSSNPNALGVSGTVDAQAGTTAQVNVLQLAGPNQKAIINITIGGKTQEFRSKTNTFDADLTGLKGVVIDARQVTRTIETTQTVDLTSAGAVRKFDKQENTIFLSEAADNAFSAAANEALGRANDAKKAEGDVLEVQFSKNLAGLDAAQTFFLRREGVKGEDAREFKVFSTAADAKANVNALDLVDVIGGQIDAARDAVKTVRASLNKLDIGKDDLVGGFEQAQKGLADIQKNLEALVPTFDGQQKDLEDAIAELKGANKQLADATGRINGRQSASAAFNDASTLVEDFRQRLKNGEDLDPDKVVASISPKLDSLKKEFGAIPEGQDKDVQKALQNVLNQFDELKSAAADVGGADKEKDKKSAANKFESALNGLDNQLDTLGKRFQTQSNEVDRNARNDVAESLTDEKIILRRIARDRNQEGNNISVASVDLATVKRATKTVTTDHPVTVQVLQDPELARKSIETLVSKVAEAVNLVQNDDELKKDVTFRKAASGLRRALNEIVGASNGGIQGSSTSDVLTVDTAKLSAALVDEPAFRRIESALQRRGGAAFQLINATSGAERGLEADMAGQTRQQKALESQVADLNAEAEATRKNLLAGLKDIGVSVLSGAGTQNPNQTREAERRIRQPGDRLSGLSKPAEQQRNGLLAGLGNLTSATTNVLNSRNFIQNLNGKLG